jgi:phosphoribosyl 1,2-cyclic phosphodiesterase
MYLTTLASSSSGNGYLVHNDTECLIIEAGVHLSEVKKALDFDLSCITGCLSTHSHGDHSKFIEQYAKAGITIFAHQSVFEGRAAHHNYRPVKENKVFRVGNFRIMPLPLTHDVPCFGFYINHHETGNFCFLTDTSEVPYQFKDLNHVLVECNYDTDIIDINETHYVQRNRVITSHLSYDKCDEFLSKNDLTQVHNIVLLHTSENNSDAALFRDQIRSKYIKDVYVAQKGLKINLNSEPF